jgi:hypothetical protein
MIKFVIYAVWITLLISCELTQLLSEPGANPNKVDIIEIKQLSDQIANEITTEVIKNEIKDIINEEIKKDLDIKPISKDEIPEPCQKDPWL